MEKNVTHNSMNKKPHSSHNTSKQIEKNNKKTNKLIPKLLHDSLEDHPGHVRILNNIGWLFFDRFLRMAGGLLVGVWVARYLGPEQFGILSYAAAFVGIFGTLAGMGISSIAVRDIVKNPDSASMVIGSAFALQLIAGMCSIILITAAIGWLRPDDEFTRLVVAVLSLSLIFKSADAFKYWFEARIASRYVVWVENVVFVLMSSIKVIMILAEMPLIAFVWANVCEVAAIAICMFVIYSKKTTGGYSLEWHKEEMVSLLKNSWPLLISSAAIIVYMRIDQIMLGEMLGQNSVGIYSAASKLSEVWYFIPIAITNSVFPAILEVKEKDPRLYLAFIQRLYNFLTFLSISVAIFVTAISDWLVVVLYGQDFSEAGAILAIQVWAGLFVAMGVARGKWLIAENLQHIGYFYILLAMVANILGNMILIPIYGTMGAATSTVISQAVAALVAPALFRDTRASVLMLIKSANPMEWLSAIKIWRS